MKIERNTVQWRLKLWGRWVQEPRAELARSFSPFGRYAEMQENSGIRGDGIVFDIIDGVACPPDGGLSEAVERHANAIMHNIRCRETNEAISRLPDQMRRIVIETYVVPSRERPRTSRAVGERLQLHHSTVQEALVSAHSRVSVSIYGRFEVLPAIADDSAAAA